MRRSSYSLLPQVLHLISLMIKLLFDVSMGGIDVLFCLNSGFDIINIHSSL